MDLDESSWCRMCLTPGESHISLLVKSEFNQNVIEVISQYFGNIEEFDHLPKCVCTECWNKTEDFHNFYQFVQTTQTTYLNKNRNVEQKCQFDQIFVEDLVKVADEIENEIKCENENNLEAIEFVETNTPIVEFPKKTERICDDLETVDSLDVDKGICSKEPNFDYTCDECGVDSRTLKQTLMHYKRKHGIENGYIKCCNLKFKNEQTVNDHINFHQNPNLFKCKFCGRCMRTKKSLAKHVSEHRRHKGEYICDTCNRSFNVRESIRRHLMQAHRGSFDCGMCTEKFLNKDQLKDHEEMIHKPETAIILQQQLDGLKDIIPSKRDNDQVNSTISDHFDMSCDLCSSSFNSLEQAQFHYMDEHSIPDGYIKCCGIKFKSNKNTIGHIPYHLNPENLKCKICPRQAKTVYALRVHLDLHLSRIKGKNCCPDCNKEFSRKDNLQNHIIRKHGKALHPPKKQMMSRDLPADATSSMEFFDMTCDDCSTPFTFTSLQHAKFHYLEEHQNKEGYIKCCSMKLKNTKQINDHLHFHSNPEVFKCNVCDKTFAKQLRLSSHMSKHRALEAKRYVCDVCQKVCSSNYYLKMHRKVHEKNKPTVPCNYCNRLFSTENVQKIHEKRIHHREQKRAPKTEICEFCAKNFRSRNEVLSHIRRIHTKPTGPREKFECEICNAILRNQYTLKTHMLNHSSEPQKCPQCDKMSPNPNALVSHIQSVHAERIHKCHLCEKSFKAAVALKDHVATHTGEKLYKCSFCTESFIWRPNMYSHQKKAHPDEWYASRKQKQ